MAGTQRARGWSFSASVQRGWQRLTTTTTTPTMGSHSDSPPASPTLPAAGSRRRPQSIGALSSPSGQQIPSHTTSSSSSCSFVNRLPPELWITIFELASSSTHSSFFVDPLDITADHPWDTRTYPLPLLLSSYLSTQDTLRSLCLISHTLYAPALSLLMRHVWLHRRAHARRLARTLSCRPNFGALIRRVDVEMSDTSSGAIQVSALDVRDILRHTTGLVCFTDRRGTYTNVGRWDAQYEVMLPALAAGESLRSVKVVQYAPATYGRRHWSALVEGFAGGVAAALYELGIDLSLSTSGAAGAGVGAGGHLRFPTLRVLEITLGPEGGGDALDTIATWDIPRLHTFRLLGTTEGAISSQDRVRGLTSLFTSHGTKLDHLEVESHALTLSSSTLLPNLRILTLIFTLPLSPHQLQHDAHPNVERINIRNLTHLASSTHHGTLLDQLSTFFCRSRFPRLRAIRVMSAETVPSTITRLFWTRLGDQLTREGVVLEDIFGAQLGGGGGVRPRVHRTW